MKRAVFFVSSLLVFGAVLLLAGCSKSPMDELKSDHVYSDIDHKFWMEQFNQKTKLWGQAFEYCTYEGGNKPNCDVVTKIALCDGSCDKPMPRQNF
jgi:hypothetical protein